MAVHVPLSLEAAARSARADDEHEQHPASANGSPIIVPSQDIVLASTTPIMSTAARASGSSTCTRNDLKKDSKKVNTVRGYYRDISEIEHALEAKVVGLHSKDQVRFPNVDDKGNAIDKWYETTPGRALLSQVLRAIQGPLRRREQAHDEAGNLQHDRSGLPSLRSEGDGDLCCDRHHGAGLLPRVLKAALVRKDDMVVPQKKWGIVDRPANSPRNSSSNDRTDGLITQGEKYNKVVDAWSKFHR